MKVIETVGKKVEDAILEGLKQLNVSQDDVDVEILSQGGFLKKAKVRLTYKEAGDTKETVLASQAAELPTNEKITAKKEDSVKSESKKAVKEKSEKPKKAAALKKTETAVETDKTVKQEVLKPQAVKAENVVMPSEKKNTSFEKNSVQEEKTNLLKKDFGKKFDGAKHPVSLQIIENGKAFLTNVLSKMGIVATLEIDGSDGLNINILTEDSSIIGYRGEMLDSLQYLLSLCVNKGEEKFVRVNLDSLDYRNKRESILIGLANKMAEKCLRNNRKVSLEPMTSAHRRVIHATLSENDKVITRSEGKEPNRHIVILPKQ